MNTKNLIIVAAAAVAVFMVLRASAGQRYATRSGQNVVPGSAQDRQLAEQCGGWAECLAGYGL